MAGAFVTGASFGAALAAAGIYQPDVIIAQLELENWHMIQTFLTASGTSMLIVTISRHLGYINMKPRSYSSLGILPTSLDGNIIGGLFQGVGMALAGACSGTVFAQVGSSVRSGLYTLGGAMLGGVIWSGVLRDAIQRRKQARASRQKKTHPSNNNKGESTTTTILSVPDLLGTQSSLPALALIETAFAAAVAAVSLLGLAKKTTGALVDPVTGGLLVAGAQLVSIVTRGSLLGTSTSFEELGDYVAWWVLGRGKPTSRSALVLVAGMMAGALGVSFAMPPQTAAAAAGAVKPLVGGALIALGSRMAGGCTSGHGISGMSLLSVSSFVTIAAMFAGGMGTVALLK
ncbi:hypothetical protein F4810DRAFT_202999 [Camillea tinctor]|nr:hypothetical protein F4810DRAFT_202999 [Camillea tinctor]